MQEFLDLSDLLFIILADLAPFLKPCKLRIQSTIEPLYYFKSRDFQEDCGDWSWKWFLHSCSSGLTVVTRSPDSNNVASSTVGTALPKFAIRGMLKTFGLHGVVLDVDSVSDRASMYPDQGWRAHLLSCQMTFSWPNPSWWLIINSLSCLFWRALPSGSQGLFLASAFRHYPWWYQKSNWGWLHTCKASTISQAPIINSKLSVLSAWPDCLFCVSHVLVYPALYLPRSPRKICPVSLLNVRSSPWVLIGVLNSLLPTHKNWKLLFPSEAIER